MTINIPEEVNFILKKLQDNGFEGYLVGGCVRDSIMGNTPHDWDICTNAKPEQTQACFSEYNTIDVGKKHGTIGVIMHGGIYEITTYRVDGEYEDNRHPQSVEFTSNIKDDLSRRDFTVNAIAYNESNRLVDPFGGREDITKKLIKCVGNPIDRFGEDSLRILRGMRFASRFGFDIETRTAKAVHDCKSLLHNVANERIREELIGILCGKSVEQILNEYRDVIAEIIPEITPCFDFEQRTPHHCYDVYRHIVHSVGVIEPDPLLRMTMLMHDIGKPQACTTGYEGRRHFKGHPKISAQIADRVLKRLRFSNAFIADCLKLVEYHDVRFSGNKRTVRRILGKIGRENMERLFKIQYADTMSQSDYNREQKLSNIETAKNHLEEIIRDNECFSLKQLAVNGSDLIEIGITNGKEIGDTLNYLFEKVLNEELENDRQALINAVKNRG